MSFMASTSKHNTRDTAYFTKKMQKGELVTVQVETHLIGLPTNGSLIEPRYITKVYEEE